MTRCTPCVLCGTHRKLATVHRIAVRLRRSSRRCCLRSHSESKLIISHYIGQRDAESAWYFMRDLRARTEGIFQLTSDGLRAYVDAVDAHFATSIHFVQLIKLYSSPDITGPDWYGATSRVTGTIPSVRCGRPEPRFVSTSHVERLNLSVRTIFAATPAERTRTAATGESQGVCCALGCVV